MSGSDVTGDGRDIASLDNGGDEEADFIDQIALEGFSECLPTPLDQDARDTLLSKFLQHLPQCHACKKQGAVAVGVGKELGFPGDLSAA